MDALADIIALATTEVSAAADLAALDAVRVRFLGKKGVLTERLKALGSLPSEERRTAGQAINDAKDLLQRALEDRRAALEAAALEAKLAAERIDVTLPGRGGRPGGLHPITRTLDRIERIFAQAGFSVTEGPEIEDDYHNFGALNIPEHHPARAMHDTFYMDTPALHTGPGGAPAPGALLLRTHTSPNQVHIMRQLQPPLRVVVPGKVYRYEQVDPSHNWMFYQCEGFAVDRGITMADLKGTIAAVLGHVFGPRRPLRFRNDYFPYVEPGLDASVQCILCDGAGCRMCKGTGWLEVMPAGMVHPNVLRNCGIDPEHYSGFAFGAGPDRIAAVRWQIEDIRHLYQGDLRFIRQFRSTMRPPES